MDKQRGTRRLIMKNDKIGIFLKQIGIVFFVFICLTFPSFAQSSIVVQNSEVIHAGKIYTVGREIKPGTYSIDFYPPNSERSSIEVRIGKDAYKLNKGEDSPVVELNPGEEIYIINGSAWLISTDDVSKKENPSNAFSQEENGLSQEEIKKMINSAPYVSNKNIVIDSQEGVDFYTYFGSGIVMSGTSGNCFKMVDCDDETIVDHYKLMPVKAGKGKIEYVINMKKKIVVNVVVKDSALYSNEASLIDNKKTATVIKGVNIRAEANSSSKKVGSAKPGDRLTVLQPYYTNKWHQILYDGEICYVSANYVKLN